jgi:hypothetical protein
MHLDTAVRRSRMNRALRRCALASFAAFAVAGAPAAPASADGLPFPLDASSTGVTNPGGDSRYSTVAAGAGTVVLRTAVDGGTVERSRLLRENFAVPAVAYDGSSSGLSADGKTLVLIKPRLRFPRSKTAFAVLDPQRLRVEKQITLDGDFSFDAISPDGRTLYLIEYVDRRDPTAYQVRAYDLSRQRLIKEPIVDPKAAPVTMGGSPVTLATSPDGRWAYTLYDSLDRKRPPFIHALDTETGTAACIDLEGGLIERRRLFRMKLDPSPDGSTLAVLDRGEPVAVVDTATFVVTRPTPAAESEEGGGVPWALAGLTVVALGGVFAVVRRRRRRSRAVGPEELERLVEVDAEERKPVAR